MNFILHILTLVVLYSAVMGWRANRLKSTALLSDRDKESLFISQQYFFLMYSSILFSIGWRVDGMVFFVISSVFNVYLIEKLWVKNEKFRNYLNSSILTSTIKLVVVSSVTAFSLWYSGVIIEEITWVPASTLSNTVLVLSITMATIIYLALVVFSAEVMALILIFVVFIESIKNESHRHLMEFVTIAIFIIPCLFLFSYLGDTVFSASFIRERLYDSYHSNIRGSENNRVQCDNIPTLAKLKPVSDTRVSYIIFLSPSGQYQFDTDDCYLEEIKQGNAEKS